MNYYELKKKATDSPWENEGCAIYTVARPGPGCDVGRRSVAGTLGHLHGKELEQEDEANAAIIAHCVSKFDRALAIIKCTDDGTRTRDCYKSVTGRDYDVDVAELETVEGI